MKHHADGVTPMKKTQFIELIIHRSKLAAVTSPHVAARIVRSVLAAYFAEIAELQEMTPVLYYQFQTDGAIKCKQEKTISENLGFSDVRRNLPLCHILHSLLPISHPCFSVFLLIYSFPFLVLPLIFLLLLLPLLLLLLLGLLPRPT
jgi:hypothetical protein